MAWDPVTPTDFSQFEPADMLVFLDWFERSYENAIALGIADSFIEGLTEPYLEVLAQGQPVPEWIETMLRYRQAAMWAYQQQIPLAARVRRNIANIIPDDQVMDYAERFRITPEDIANVPPAVQRSFTEGSRFSLKWIKRLSNDARGMMRDVMAIESLKNRNPIDAVPLLEGLLRRDIVARKRGITPDDVTPAMVQEWLITAETKLLNELATRAELISVTESMRMMNLGILTSLEEQGLEHCYVMPHSGSCDECRRLIDGRVFKISGLKENLFVNFGVKQSEWKPALPQHPRCRHSAGKVPVRFRRKIAATEIPPEGVVLEYYGLPGGRSAMEALDLPEVPWVTT